MAAKKKDKDDAPLNWFDTLRVELDYFSGPVDYLVALVDREEIALGDLELKPIINQYRRCCLEFDQEEELLEKGSCFIEVMAQLALMKSKLFLPEQEPDLLPQEGLFDEASINAKIWQNIAIYRQIRKAVNRLQNIEQEQLSHYYRGHLEWKPQLPLGLEPVSIEDLSELFKTLVKNAKARQGTVHEERFKIKDKIEELTALLETEETVGFDDLFSASLSKAELIVLFLALLELMKCGKICVASDANGLLSIHKNCS